MANNHQAEQYLTPEGREKLEAELEHLETVKRREVAELIASAKEEGDISENAAYDEAKNQQAFLEGRIQDIRRILNNAVEIEDNGQSDVVDIGSQVTVREQGLDEQETFRIVGSAEANPGNGYISNVSPIGKALLGHHVGDVVKVKTPGGEVHFEIRDIG
jgi:transcription elongation factor GreA